MFTRLSLASSPIRMRHPRMASFPNSRLQTRHELGLLRVVDPADDGDDVVLVVDEDDVVAVTDEGECVFAGGGEQLFVGVQEPVHVTVAGIRAGWRAGERDPFARENLGVAPLAVV